MQRIIIVTGTPGVGKTILAKRLAGKTKSDYVNVGELVRERQLYKYYDRPSRSYVIDEARLGKSLNSLLKAHPVKGLIIETHSIGSFMPKRKGLIALVVRLDPVVLARRLRARGWSKKKIWENVESELIDLSLYEALKTYGVKKVYELDATGKAPGRIVEESIRLLSKARGWNGSTPNWLLRYDPIELSRKIL